MNETSRVTAERPSGPTASRAAVEILGVSFERVLSASAGAACIGLIFYKLVLVRLINVNWDEFAFLSLVYELTRGELTVLIQGSFTHLFAWLPRIAGDEIDQIVVARYVMVALLALTAWLVWRLARVWLEGFPALVPVFVYLSTMAVLEHGGSFRFDSMLAPLSVAPLVLLLAPGFGHRRDWLAGCLLGIGFAVSVKVVLFAPVIALTVLLRGPNANGALVDWRESTRTLARVAVAGTVVAAVLIALHWLAISPVPSSSVTGFAGSVAKKTLLDVPWFPRFDYFARSFDWQPFPWLMIALGALIALARRDFVIAALGLSLLPLAFYRNAFPYYYVVMLAPASVLAGYAVAQIWALVRPRASAAVSNSLIAALWVGLLIQAFRFASLLAFDDQVLQRQIVATAHQIFPEPVNYIDRCGMIPAFRKVNFFMSTWGVENYRARNEPFMPRALRDHQPAFVLWNTGSLSPDNTGPYGLLPEDRELLARHYLYYWGPIRVAGARGVIESPNPLTVTVPFAADYRLVAAEPVLVNGVLRGNGDIITAPAEGITISRAPGATGGATSVALILASARPAPANEPTPTPLFRGL